MDELRETCAEIARRARAVTIREAAIEEYAAGLTASAHTGDEADELAGAGTEERAAHWLTLDAINFGSGWFPTLRKPDGRSGYQTIAGAWRAHTVTEGPFTAAQLTQLDAPAVAAILGQDPAHELIELFALSLRDLGEHLLAEHRGSVTALIAAAGGSAVAFADHLGEWACFADRSRYDELSVGFLKRAQIAAADLRRAGVADWYDAARLTMFADNLVPHVLRLDGVLSFAPELVARIDAGQLIEHGSTEEVEIRACALHAVERLVAARGHDVTAASVDQTLWERGQGPRYKSRPRHRSRCTAY